jgi:hypothetical protein
MQVATWRLKLARTTKEKNNVLFRESQSKAKFAWVKSAHKTAQKIALLRMVSIEKLILK